MSFKLRQIYIILLLYQVVFPRLIFATQITTSITPIASLVKMLVREHAEVNSIATQGGCPEHYQASFGDFKKIRDADLVIYIDDKFDHFISKLLKQNKNLIKISDFKRLNIIKDNKQNNNWHIWLDLDNIVIIIEELALILQQKFPNFKSDIITNLAVAKNKIIKLAAIKNIELQNLKNIIIASDSLEYLFLDKNSNVIKIYQYDSNSLSYVQLIDNFKRNKEKTCLVLSNDQNIKLYKKFTIPYAQVESENWQEEGDVADLFYNKYIQIIKKLSNCN